MNFSEQLGNWLIISIVILFLGFCAADRALGHYEYFEGTVIEKNHEVEEITEVEEPEEETLNGKRTIRRETTRLVDKYYITVQTASNTHTLDITHHQFLNTRIKDKVVIRHLKGKFTNSYGYSLYQNQNGYMFDNNF